MSRRVKIGLIQVKQRPEDGYEKRLDILYGMAEECLKAGAELVFFPEAYQHVPDRQIIYRPEELQIKFEGWKERCAALARQYHAYVVPWDYEVKDGEIYNCSYILDREGREVGRFRKVHLTHAEIERGIAHGDDFPVFDLDFGKVGIMICFDNYYPESARILGNRGAELVLYPLYGDTLLPQWELKMRARAVDNSMYIACCQIDNRQGISYTGVVDPLGNTIARLELQPSWAVAEIEMGAAVDTHTTGSPDHTENIRDYLARCRWPKAYGGLLEETPDPRSWDEIFYGNPPHILTKKEYTEGK